MTPKEKAIELVDKYRGLVISAPYVDSEDGSCIAETWMLTRSAKQCALIAVDEIILSAPFEPADTDWDEAGASAQYWYPQKLEDSAKWWAEVKQEIQKL